MLVSSAWLWNCWLINIEFVFKGYGDAVASAALTLVEADRDKDIRCEVEYDGLYNAMNYTMNTNISKTHIDFCMIRFKTCILCTRAVKALCKHTKHVSAKTNW